MGRLSNLQIAAACAIVAGLIGCVLFQASSLSFDYMKLRQLPVYASAGSIAEFNTTVESIGDEMRDRRGLIRSLLRDRSTIALDQATSNERARSTVVEARVFLRGNLNPVQLRALEFEAAAVSFNDTDGMFQRICNGEENAQAVRASSVLTEETVPAPAATEPSVQLTPSQRQAFAVACAIPPEYCAGNEPSPESGQRARMICAQTALQGLNSRATALNAFNYDGALYLSEALKLSYPSIIAEDANRAIQVAEAYRSLTRTSQSRGCLESTAQNRAACTELGTGRNWAASVWDFLFSLPLAVIYLALAFLFGAMGSLTNYLFATVAPNAVAATPEDAPLYALVAGGGSAVLVLLVVMAGFQFLAVGAATPDLAYPNPLTVCGLAVLVGLRGEGVLIVLKDWIGKFFSTSRDSSGSSPPPNDPSARGGPTDNAPQG